MMLRKDLYPSRSEQPETIMRRLDPVIYSQWSLKAPISQEQHSFYQENGYLILEHLLEKEELDSIRRSIELLKNDPHIRESELCITEPGSDSIRSIFDLAKIDSLIAEIADNSPFREIATYILNDSVYIHQSRVNFKPAFHGKGFYWHSDFETWHTEDGMPRMRALSICLALTDNFSGNGPLMIIPGSHKKFIACTGSTPDEHFNSSLKDQKYGVPSESMVKNLAEEHGIKEISIKAGSVVVFDCNLIHGSGSNMSPYRRENLFLVYNAISNRLTEPFSEKPPRPGYLAKRDNP